MSIKCPKCFSDDWKSARLVVLEGTTISRGTLSGQVKGSRVSNSKSQDYLLADRWFTYNQELDAELNSTTVSALVDEIKELMVSEASARPMPPTPQEPQTLPMPEKRLIVKPKGRGFLSVDPNKFPAPKKPQEPENPLNDIENFEPQSWLTNFIGSAKSSLVWVLILLLAGNYLFPEQFSDHYKRLLLTLDFVSLPNNAYTWVTPYFDLPNSEILFAASEWVKSLELSSKWRGVLAGTITFLAIGLARVFLIVISAHKIEKKRQNTYDAIVQKLAERWEKIRQKFEEEQVAYQRKFDERLAEIKRFEKEAQNYGAAIKLYENEVGKVEEEYSAELEIRNQIMNARQSRYLEELSNYDAQVAIVKSFRGELWDRARVCTRCGAPYLALRVNAGSNLILGQTEIRRESD